jgi:hypothetical protein
MRKLEKDLETEALWIVLNWTLIWRRLNSDNYDAFSWKQHRNIFSTENESWRPL